MIIESIAIKNFKSHRDTKIEFNTGISIIMGDNGAGKSSILEAVSFALFKQHSGKKIDQLIRIDRQNPAGQNKMSVELEFTSSGRTYRVLRERGKNTSKAKIEIKEGEGFQPLSIGDKQVTDDVQALLEMDGDLFLNAVYVRQGEIANLVNKTPSEKKQVIGKLLGIESLEKAWKNMLPLMNQYEMEKIKLDGKLESLDGLNGEITQKKDEKNFIHQNIQDLSQKLEKIDEELVLINKENTKLEHDKSVYDRAVNGIESKKQIIDNLERDHNHLNKQITDIKLKEDEIKIIKPKLSKLKVLKTLKQNLENLKQLQKNKKQVIGTLEKIDEYKSTLEVNKKFYTEYSDLSDEIRELESKRSDFEGSRELIKQNQKRREQTLQKMNLSHNKIVKVINDYNNKIGTSYSVVEELETYIKSKKPELADKIETITVKINSIGNELSNLEIQNKNLIKPIDELENIKNQCPICKSPINSDKRDELINDYNSQVETNKNRMVQLKHEQEKLRSEKQIMDMEQNNIRSVNIELLMEQLKNLEEGSKELMALKNKVKSLEDRVTSLNEIDGLLNQKKKELLEIKPGYESYLIAEGLLESIGNPIEIGEELEKIQDDEAVTKEQVTCLIEATGGSVEDLDREIEYLDKLNQTYQQLSGAIQQKEDLIIRMEQVTQNLEAEKQQLERYVHDVNEVNYKEEIHKKIKDDLKIKNEELSVLNGKKQELIGKQSGLDSYLDGLEIKLESYKNFEKEIRHLKDFLKLLDHIREIYGKDGVQKDLRNLSRPLIEQNTRDFFEKFNFEYSDIRLDEDYDVTVYGPSGESNLDMISGGEKIAVALALRLGITQTLSGGNLELIMLDEPTIHLDAYRRQELIELLKKMSIIPQMIIVTHDPDIEEAADHIIRVKKKEGESIISE
jgi:DNA repair protein SbcC/Rad50